MGQLREERYYSPDGATSLVLRLAEETPCWVDSLPLDLVVNGTVLRRRSVDIEWYASMGTKVSLWICAPDTGRDSKVALRSVLSAMLNLLDTSVT